tara:strand:- start:10497 stop:11462 length:966 start_codon:yes stop_codon:yes gene_type:complete
MINLLKNKMHVLMQPPIGPDYQIGGDMGTSWEDYYQAPPGSSQYETPTPSTTSSTPADWHSSHNHRWSGSDWYVAHEWAHSGGKDGAPPQQMEHDGKTWYSHPIIQDNGIVWRWEWKETPATIVGSDANVMTTDPGTAKEYTYQDIFDLSQSLASGDSDETILQRFMEDAGISSISPQAKTQLLSKLKDMPTFEIDEKLESIATDKYNLATKSIDKRREDLLKGFSSDVKTIAEGIGAGRRKVETAAGQSGVRTSSGFAGMKEIEESGYRKAGDLQSGLKTNIFGLGTEQQQADIGYESSIYGLESDVVSEFEQWMSNLYS